MKHWVILPPSRELDTDKPKGEGGFGCLWGGWSVLLFCTYSFVWPVPDSYEGGSITHSFTILSRILLQKQDFTRQRSTFLD